MDALWFRLPREASDTLGTMGRFDAGRIFVTLNRGDYWQCAFVIPKGANDAVRARGLDAFRTDVAQLAKVPRARAQAIASWDEVKLLTVQVDRLKQWWKPGLLCIGDAAHAMSPIGGVGINLAIQDAVAAANVLAEPLRLGQSRRSATRRCPKAPGVADARHAAAATHHATAHDRAGVDGQGPVRPPALLALADAHSATAATPGACGRSRHSARAHPDARAQLTACRYRHFTRSASRGTLSFRVDHGSRT